MSNSGNDDTSKGATPPVADADMAPVLQWFSDEANLVARPTFQNLLGKVAVNPKEPTQTRVSAIEGGSIVLKSTAAKILSLHVLTEKLSALKSPFAFAHVRDIWDKFEGDTLTPAREILTQLKEDDETPKRVRSAAAKALEILPAAPEALGTRLQPGTRTVPVVRFN